MVNVCRAPIDTKLLGSLFNVDALSRPDLVEKLGGWARLKDPALCDGLIGLFPFKLVHLQRDWRGEMVFRGYNQAARFGRPLLPERLEFLTESQARRVWRFRSVEVFDSPELLEFDPDFL